MYLLTFDRTALVRRLRSYTDAVFRYCDCTKYRGSEGRETTTRIRGLSSSADEKDL